MKRLLLVASLILCFGVVAAPAQTEHGRITQAPVTFAALGTPNNGTFAYCSDCAFSTNPCTGGGTGAPAWRLNNVWVCGVPSGATAYLGLSDTPSSYSGTANQFVRVNATPDGLVFFDLLGTGNTWTVSQTFTDLTVNDLITFTETAGDDTCAAGDFWLKGNSSLNKLRGCENGSLFTLSAGGGGAIGYQTIEDEGTPLTQRTTLNFVGVHMTCVDDTTRTTCTLTGTSTKEQPAGTLNGVNKVFTFSRDIDNTTFRLLWNGLTQVETDDYAITGPKEITMVLAPAAIDKLFAYY